jgi:hypothetical protein
MEREAKAILEQVCGPGVREVEPLEVQKYVQDLYGGLAPQGVVDELIAERRAEARAE